MFWQAEEDKDIDSLLVTITMDSFTKSDFMDDSPDPLRCAMSRVENRPEHCNVAGQTLTQCYRYGRVTPLYDWRYTVPYLPVAPSLCPPHFQVRQLKAVSVMRYVHGYSSLRSSLFHAEVRDMTFKKFI